MTDRPDFFTLHNGEKASLPFSAAEYADRLRRLRKTMESRGLDAVLLTSMQNIAYYSGFLYCAFGRPYGCIVTASDCVTISANIDAGQPWEIWSVFASTASCSSFVYPVCGWSV